MIQGRGAHQDVPWIWTASAPVESAPLWQAVVNALLWERGPELIVAMEALRAQGLPVAALALQCARPEEPTVSVAEYLCGSAWADGIGLTLQAGVDLWPGMPYALVQPYGLTALALRQQVLEKATPDRLWQTGSLWDPAPRNGVPRRRDEQGSLLHQYLSLPSHNAWLSAIQAAYGPVIVDRPDLPSGDRALDALIQGRLSQLTPLVDLLPFLPRAAWATLTWSRDSIADALNPEPPPQQRSWLLALDQLALGMGDGTLRALWEQDIPISPELWAPMRNRLATLSGSDLLGPVSHRVASAERQQVLTQVSAPAPGRSRPRA